MDLVIARQLGKEVRRFKNVAALRAYTQRTKKFFPRKAAKEDGFLKALLRVLG